MSPLPASRPRPRDSAKPIDDFDWPPTGDDLSVHEIEPNPGQTRQRASRPAAAARPASAPRQRERPQARQTRSAEPAPKTMQTLVAVLAASAIVAAAAGCVLYASLARPVPVAVQKVHHQAPPAATTAPPPKIKIIATYPVEPDPASAAPAESPDAGIRSLLARYEEAYDRRDVRAAVERWPTVDQGALTRAFAATVRQNVHFDRCDIDASEARGSAVCVGTVRYVAKIASGVEQEDRINWTFDLARSGEVWRITGLSAH